MGLYGEGVSVDLDVGCQKGFENLSSEIDSLLEASTAAPGSPLSATTDSSPNDDELLDELKFTPDNIGQWSLDLDATYRPERDRCHSFDEYALAGVDDLVMTDDKMDMDPAHASARCDADEDTDGADAPEDEMAEGVMAADFLSPSPTGFDGLDLPESLGGFLPLDFLDIKRECLESAASTPNAGVTTFKAGAFGPSGIPSLAARGVVKSQVKPALVIKPEPGAQMITASSAAVPGAVRRPIVKPEPGLRSTTGLIRPPANVTDGASKNIGIYTPEARKARIARFHAKRAKRVWRKRIKYDCRKKLADSRPRIKGRFVRREDMDQLAKDGKKIPIALAHTAKDAFAQGRATRSWRLAGGLAKAVM